MVIVAIISKVDHYLFQTINQLAFRWKWLDLLGIFLSDAFGYLLVAILLIILALKFKKYWKIVLNSLIAALVARFIITDLIRWFKPRPRPFINYQINLLVDKVNQQSFPSGHAAFYFGLATVVYLNNKKLGTVFLIGAFLISVARIFVGVHWPLDILAGAAVGIFSGWLINKYLKI